MLIREKIDQECLEWAADAMGWQPLEDGAYLHVPPLEDGGAEYVECVVDVVGVATVDMAELNLLLLG